MNTSTKIKPSAFAGTGDEMAAGLDALFNTEAEFAFVEITMIDIKKQVRETFEAEGNLLSEMAESIKDVGVIQPVLLRETETGYELIAGERRIKASVLAGKTNVPALIRKMTDEQAKTAQFIENIHRLNLTQIEEAKHVQADLDALGGDVKAVLEKYKKSASWLSKLLSLLNLTPEAKRLVTENISADVEVISAVRAVEKVDPAKAKVLVDDLKATRGKENAREKANQVKEEVKPSKKQTKPQAAKPKPESKVKDGSKDEDPLRDLLQRIYMEVTVRGHKAENVLRKLSEPEFDGLRNDLTYFHKQGAVKQDAGRSILGGFNQGMFSHGDYREFRLSAYSYGLNHAEFNLESILASVK